MSVVCIAGPDDPRVAEYRHVPDPELVRARGLFVAEGRAVVQRALEGARFRVLSVLLSDAALGALGSWIDGLPSDVPVYVCETRHFEHITGYNIHRGCLALFHRGAPLEVGAVISGARTIVVLDGVSNADNVGGVFRNVAGFGADAVLLGPTCCDPLYRKAVRTSMAATLRVPFARLAATEYAWPDVLATLRECGFTLVALTPRQPAQDLDEFAARPRPPKLALIVGGEGAGLSPEVEAAADHRVCIRIRKAIDSLNLSVAAGIALSRLSPVEPG